MWDEQGHCVCADCRALRSLWGTLYAQTVMRMRRLTGVVRDEDDPRIWWKQEEGNT